MISLIIQGNTLPECVDKYIDAYYDYFDEIVISSYKSEYLDLLNTRQLLKLNIV